MRAVFLLVFSSLVSTHGDRMDTWQGAKCRSGNFYPENNTKGVQYIK